MSIVLKFHAGDVEQARAVYSTSDFTLDYKLEQKSLPAPGGIQARIDSALHVRPGSWLGIADTLVIAFGPPDAQLVAIDAYTNRDLWSRAAALPLPDVMDAARACLANPPQDADRIDLGVVPRFEYCEREARLRVTFGRRANSYYRVSTCLVIGVDDAAIASLDFSDLRIDEPPVQAPRLR